MNRSAGSLRVKDSRADDAPRVKRALKPASVPRVPQCDDADQKQGGRQQSQADAPQLRDRPNFNGHIRVRDRLPVTLCGQSDPRRSNSTPILVACFASGCPGRPSGRPRGKGRVRGRQNRVVPRLCGVKARRPKGGFRASWVRRQPAASAAVAFLVDANR